MAMNPKQAQWWAKRREIGRSRFIWFYGVLGWGISVGLLWPLIMSVLMGWKLLPMLTYGLIAFPVGGYFFGFWTWRLNEAQYERAVEGNDHIAHIP